MQLHHQQTATPRGAEGELTRIHPIGDVTLTVVKPPRYGELRIEGMRYVYTATYRAHDSAVLRTTDGAGAMDHRVELDTLANSPDLDPVLLDTRVEATFGREVVIPCPFRKNGRRMACEVVGEPTPRHDPITVKGSTLRYRPVSEALSDMFLVRPRGTDIAPVSISVFISGRPERMLE